MARKKAHQTKNIWENGGIYLPRFVRRKLEISSGSEMELYFDEEKQEIVLKPAKNN